MNNINGNELIFTVPFNENIDIFQTIEQLLNQINNETNILHRCDNDYIELDIQFDMLDQREQNNIYNFFHNNLHNNYITNDHFDLDHFNYCHEIDEKINKSEKIKKDDKILTEQCFICMDDYKQRQFKRELPKCKHYFHKKCIDKWLKKKASCPICRDDLLK
jgi:hypothetical protein